MSEPSPLAGLTAEQADEAIDRFKAKVDQGIGGQAAKDHLKAMRAARKTLTEPAPVDAQGNGVVAQADSAQITVEGGDV